MFFCLGGLCLGSLVLVLFERGSEGASEDVYDLVLIPSLLSSAFSGWNRYTMLLSCLVCVDGRLSGSEDVISV
jgi:hypothetical protein